MIFIDMTLPTMRIFLANLQSPTGPRDAESLLLLPAFCSLYSRVSESLFRHLRFIAQMCEWRNPLADHILNHLEQKADMLRFVFSLVPRHQWHCVSPRQSPPGASTAASGRSPTNACAWLPGGTALSENEEVISGIDQLLTVLETWSEHSRKNPSLVDQSRLIFSERHIFESAAQPALEALFLVYPALCIHLWHNVCRCLRTFDEKQLRTIGE